MKKLIIILCISISPQHFTQIPHHGSVKTQSMKSGVKNKTCQSGSVLDSTFKISINNQSKVEVCTHKKCWNGQAVSHNNLNQQL